MKQVTIDNKIFFAPADCTHIAVDRDSRVFAYHSEPVLSNVYDGWRVYHGQEGIYIGRLYPDPETVIEDFHTLMKPV